MRNSIFYLIVFFIFILIACGDKSNYQETNNRNIYIDDSLIQLYLPLTILDSMVPGEQRIGVNGYMLLESCGDLYINKQNTYSSVNIVSECDTSTFDTLPDILLQLVLQKQLYDIKTYSEWETFISLDTIRINGKKSGILTKVEGCGDSSLYTISCFLPSAHNNRIYRIIISCDKSETGNMLRDSLPLILSSLYISKP